MAKKTETCATCGKSAQWLSIRPGDMDSVLSASKTDKEFRKALDALPKYCSTECWPRSQ